MRRLLRYTVIVGTAAASAGCSSLAPLRGGARVVLAVQTGITDGYTRNRNEIVDIGLPPLHNLTGYTVRLRWVRWVNQPASARIISVHAYTYAQVGHGFIGAEGSLPIACPGQYKPVSVTSVVTPPHGDSRWFVVVTFTIAKVGFYHLNRVKIGYVTAGHRGWQYQNLDTSYKIVNPPLPGPVPIPRTGICG